MKWILFLSLFLTQMVYAQLLPTTQSSSDLNWRELENEFVKIYYPEFLEDKAQYIAHLINHYQKVVGISYKMNKMKKFPLILRAEMAQPNGFVALMPRRSEWFSAANITPFVGALEWYQALAVHEYRHVVQFDHMFQGYNETLYYILGELGQSLGIVLTAPVWFFEGDAVWTETKYSDAGRGRSPRFSARLRALIDADYFPTYDNYLAGDFEIPLPNHYVFGYFTTTRAYQVYGEDIWRKIINRSANWFPQPYRFYSAFKKITNEPFDKFFQDSMKSLQTKKKKIEPKKLKQYRQYAWPMVDGFFSYVLKRDLDNFWTLYEVSGKPKKIKELNIDPSFSQPDLKRGYMVYTQSLPDRRFQYKQYSDIYLLSAYSKINTRVTYENRYYHPKIHPKRNEIYALHFDEKNQWSVEVVDFEGKILKRLKIKDLLITEFEFIDENNLALLTQDKIGLKSIQRINLKTQKLTYLIGNKTRNNLFALQYNNNHLYFEADYQGKVETLAYDLKKKALKNCSNATYANFHPYVEKGIRHYIDLDAQGTDYKKEKLNCKRIKNSTLSDKSLYLSKGIADNYIKSKPVAMTSYEKLTSKKIESDEYQKSSDVLKVHSWNFLGGRGFQVGVESNNYLGDVGVSGAVGIDAEEETPFSNLTINYAKYYPIYSLSIDYSDRNIEYTTGDNDEFTQLQATLGITLPYYWRSNLFQGLTTLSVAGGVIQVSDRERARSYEADDEQLSTTSAQFTYSNLKDTRYRELLPSAGFTYSILTQKVDSTEDDDFDNYLTYQKATFLKNGFAANHAFKLTIEDERQRESTNSFRISSPSQEVNQYVFARGYEYEYTPHYFKSTANYYMPLKYLRWQFRDYLLVNRIYSNLFFDYTKTDVNDEIRTFNSYGAELYFDTLTLRTLPLTWGLRMMQNMKEEKGIGEVFVAVGLEI